MTDADPMNNGHHLEVRCTATSKQTGVRCGNPPAKGATVCRFHGAGAPQVQRKADQRILQAAEDIREMLPAATRELKRLVDGDKTKQEVRLSAIRDVFDRAGLVIVKKNEVKVSEGEYTFVIETHDDADLA
jgi:hypothetical protein